MTAGAPPLVVRGGRLPSGAPVDVALAHGRVTAVEPAGRPDPVGGATVLDATGLVVAPGLVDLQCNGALGIDLGREPHRLWEVAVALPRWGVTAWLPTIVTGPPERVEVARTTLAAGPPDGLGPHARPLGLHLEGPVLAPTRRGAHRARWLRGPADVDAGRWSAADGVRLVTLAPEVAGSLDLVRRLVAAGVAVAMGHSEATAEQARAGADAGATMVTHLWNAMAPLHHRAPGLAGVALSDPRLAVGVIADGVHVAREVVAASAAALGDRLVLVSDAAGVLGAAEDAARLADGTLAGSAIGLGDAVANVVAWAGVTLPAALRAASRTPAQVIGAPGGTGTLRVGAPADLVVVDTDGTVVHTVARGHLVPPARDHGPGTPAR